MKILLVTASVDFSIGDVSRGYCSALTKAGHDLAFYVMRSRYEYHMRALPKELHSDQSLVCKMASENIAIEALYHQADLVVVISGLNVHPIALWLLERVDVPVAVILTESPYDDEEQETWITKASSKVNVFTNDAYSAIIKGWDFLAPAFDPTFHKPSQPDSDGDCDVLMVGTGWPERQAFLESVDWTGVNLKIYGIWPGLLDNPSSPLHRFFHPMIIDNSRIAGLYSAAKINLNFHRTSKVAITPGPRVYELAACEAFQISDFRAGVKQLFGENIPTFETPVQLENLIKMYLADDFARRKCAVATRNCVKNQTFDARVQRMMEVLEEKEIASGVNSR